MRPAQLNVARVVSKHFNISVAEAYRHNPQRAEFNTLAEGQALAGDLLQIIDSSHVTLGKLEHHGEESDLNNWTNLATHPIDY